MKKNKAFIFAAAFSSLSTILLVGCFAVYKLNCFVMPLRLMLFPVIVAAVSWLCCIFKRLPNFIKYSVVLLCFLLSLGFYGFTFLGGREEFRVYEGVEEIIEYNEKAESKDVDSRLLFHSPQVETERYGSFSDITYYAYHFWAIFADHAYTVIAQYTDEEFEKTVMALENTYDFAEQPVLEGDALPYVSYDGFDFRVVADENLEEYYPKSLDVIGINRDTREIAHISFTNMDLDSILDFERFIRSYCGWYYIQKNRK